MTKIEIVDVHALKSLDYDGRNVERELKTYANRYIQLRNGTWLKDMGDGRLFDDDTGEYWGWVDLNTYDKYGDVEHSENIGFCKV